MSASVEELDSEYEWNVGFGDTNYVVNLAVKGSLISLEIEEAVSNERWSGEFTAQYVEEITLKAGNFKKFSVFVKMLISSFDRENESVYVDVLTYSDLETLKARKAGAAGASDADAAGAVKSKSQMKRYVILTYRSDYDRVHYPLPLSHEETPNTESMRRTIRRLREVVDARNKEGRPAEFLGEKDLRAMVGNLRQENQELRHRMRQAESRSAKAASNSTGLGAPVNNSELSKVNTELMAQNSKLKKQLDTCKRDLAAADANFEKMRTEAAKDVSKWKVRALEGAHGASASSGASLGSNGSADRLDKYTSNTDAAALRHKILELERELKLERMASAQARRSAAYKRPSSASSPGGRNRSATPPPSRTTGVWSPASGAAPPRQVSRSPATSAYQARHARADPYNDPQAKENRLKAAAAAARIRERNSRLASGAGGVSTTRGSKDRDSRGSRDGTPAGRSGSAGSAGSSRDNRGRSNSPALPSSSTGGRFDPTAYQRAKELRMAQNLNDRNSFRNSVGLTSPGEHRSASNSRRDSYSGYDSADSRGSRSYRSETSADRQRAAARPFAGRRISPATNDPPQPPARKVTRRNKRSGKREGSSSGDARGGEASRGILSGSDSDDDHLRMRATSASAAAARNNNIRAEGGKGIAEANEVKETKESMVSKVVGAFPFPMAGGGSDAEGDEETGPTPSPPKRSVTGPNQHSPKLVKSGSKAQGSPKKSPARAIEGKKDMDDSMEQVLPAAHISFGYVESSGYGSMNGIADAIKSPRNSQDSNKSPRSPAGKSPTASPNRTPRSSREGLSVSFSEFRKTPGGEDEIQEIDKRIQALQSYLDNARTGLLAAASSPK